QNGQVFGNNFQGGLTVDVFDAGGELVTNQSATQILNVTANSFTVVVNFDGNAGSYGIEVINPANQRSGRFTFTVQAQQLTPAVKVGSASSRTATVGNQNVQVFGANFQDGLTVDVFDAGGELVTNQSGMQILNVTANSFTVVVNFDGNAGSYGIEVINPANQRSSRLNFTVQAQQLTPAVSGINPSSPTAMVGNQNVQVFGNNFQSRLTVDVFDVRGDLVTNQSGTQILNVMANSFTMVINFNGDVGSYGIEVNNPANQRSSRFTFTAD